MADSFGGISADTSSYPKPTLPTSPLDIAGKLGGLQSQKLDIDQKKLDQANQGLTYLTRALNSLGPNPTKEELLSKGQSIVNMGLAPPSMMDEMRRQIPNDPAKMRAFVDQLQTQTAQHQEMINHFRGPLYTNQGAARTDVLQVPGSPNYPVTPRMSIPAEPPPTFETVDPNTGQRRSIGNVPPPPAQGFNRLGIRPSAVTPPLPSGVPLNPNSIPGMRPGEKAVSATAEPPTTPGVFPTATAPLFEEGKKRYEEDQNLATQRLTSMKPALQALPLIKDLTTGIGTDTYNKALAGLHNLGLLPQGLTNKVTVRQELEKKLAQYVASNPVGQRSDAAQTLAEAGSPSPKIQINPALLKLTRDAIALDRVQVLRAGAFEGADFSRYGQHRSLFPSKIDEKALTLDMLEEKERNDLLDEMSKKRNSYEGKKFFDTLRMVKKQGIMDMSGAP